MKHRKVPTILLLHPPARLPRCALCAEHADLTCSRCHRPICRRHNAAASHTWDCYCFACSLTPTQGGTR